MHATTTAKIRRVAAAVLLSLVAGASACADEGPDAAPPLVAYDDAPRVAARPEVPCTDGDYRTCKVILGEHDGITDCFIGVELCEQGAWGSCLDEPPPDAADDDANA